MAKAHWQRRAFQTEHTIENFRRAFFMPDLFDNNAIGRWQAEGAVEMNERAPRYTRDLMANHEELRLDVGVNDAVLEYIARRERETPAADALNQEY